MVIVKPGRVLFAKNSDRDANEGQNLEWHPRTRRAGSVQCTHIEIPDIEETHAVLISRPFWIWGAEMGTNEHGVTIGNEAVFTKQPYEKDPGLIGMDLLRLALERAGTAEEACAVIGELLERHGQAGRCSHEHPNFTYHNSFIVADPAEAYVLETAGRQWTTEKVNGARSISNGLTIPGFAEQHSNGVITRIAGAPARQARTQALCRNHGSVQDLMAVLRDHNGSSEPHYAFVNGGLNVPCVHAGGVVTSSQTTASWVAELTPDGVQHWATATAAPCTSIFKPVSVDDPVEYGPRAEDRANDSLWWRHERLHRKVMRNPAELAAAFWADLVDIETQWLAHPPKSADAFAEASDLLDRWTSAVSQAETGDVRPPWTRHYWRVRNRRAGLDV